jgi:hypothetical protein
MSHLCDCETYACSCENDPVARKKAFPPCPFPCRKRDAANTFMSRRIQGRRGVLQGHLGLRLLKLREDECTLRRRFANCTQTKHEIFLHEIEFLLQL